MSDRVYSIRDLFFILLKRKAILLTALGLALLSALVYNVKAPVIYESSATVQIEEREGGEVLSEFLPKYRLTIQKVTDLVTSERVLNQVADSLVSEPEERQRFVEQLRKKIFTRKGASGSQVEVVVQWPDAVQASAILETMIPILFDAAQQKETEVNIFVRKYLEERIGKLKKELSDIQVRRLKFEQLGSLVEEKDRIVNEQARLNDLIDRMEEEIGLLREKYEKRYPDFEPDQEILVEIDSNRVSNPVEGPGLQIHPFEEFLDEDSRKSMKPLHNAYYKLDIEINSLKQSLAAELKAYQEKLKVLRARHPEMIAFGKKFTAKRQKLTKLESKKASLEIQALQYVMNRLIVQKKNLEVKQVNLDEKIKGFGKLREELRKSGLLSGEDFESKIKINESLLFNMTNRLEFIKLNERTRVSDLSLVNAPPPAGVKISPHAWINLGAFLVIGLVLGLSFAFLVETIDNTFKNIEEVERNVELPVIGLIQDYSKRVDKKRSERKLVITEVPKDPASEAFRSLRANIMFHFRGKIVFMITSAAPSEGKTTVLTNLAVAFAELGKKTLILSCNLRRPSAHRFFGMDKKEGITDWFESGEGHLADYVRPTPVANLELLNSGPIASNPSVILTSDRFKKELDNLKKLYDVVLIDCPPILPVNDSLLLASKIKKVALVYSLGETDADALVRAKNLLVEHCDARLLGIIINHIRFRSEYTAAYYHQRYYHYDYSAQSA